MNVTILLNRGWKNPFSYLPMEDKNFSRFCIGSRPEYEKRVRKNVIAQQGRFFYAVIDTDNFPSAITAVSPENDVLRVHFYWTHSGNPETYPLLSKVFNAVFNHFTSHSFRYVLFPVPSEYLGSWHRYAELRFDAFGRRLNWYMFNRKDFAVFAKLSGQYRV